MDTGLVREIRVCSVDTALLKDAGIRKTASVTANEIIAVTEAVNHFGITACLGLLVETET